MARFIQACGSFGESIQRLAWRDVEPGNPKRAAHFPPIDSGSYAEPSGNPHDQSLKTRRSAILTYVETIVPKPV